MNRKHDSLSFIQKQTKTKLYEAETKVKTIFDALTKTKLKHKTSEILNMVQFADAFNIQPKKKSETPIEQPEINFDDSGKDQLFLKSIKTNIKGAKNEDNDANSKNDWSIPNPNYKPTKHTSKSVMLNPIADIDLLT